MAVDNSILEAYRSGLEEEIHRAIDFGEHARRFVIKDQQNGDPPDLHLRIKPLKHWRSEVVITFLPFGFYIVDRSRLEHDGVYNYEDPTSIDNVIKHLKRLLL